MLSLRGFGTTVATMLADWISSCIAGLTELANRNSFVLLLRPRRNARPLFLSQTSWSIRTIAKTDESLHMEKWLMMS
ncbi:hypothetical protein Hanom_Chr10g00934651 [Helianthus anomalus]